MNWYIIRTTEVSDNQNRQYIGVSKLSLKEMQAAMAGKAPVVLEELTLVSVGGETKKYSDDWEPHPNTVLLNPLHITSIVPLKDDWHSYQTSWDASLLKKVEDFLSVLKG